MAKKLVKLHVTSTRQTESIDPPAPKSVAFSDSVEKRFAKLEAEIASLATDFDKRSTSAAEDFDKRLTNVGTEIEEIKKDISDLHTYGKVTSR